MPKKATKTKDGEKEPEKKTARRAGVKKAGTAKSVTKKKETAIVAVKDRKPVAKKHGKKKVEKPVQIAEENIDNEENVEDRCFVRWTERDFFRSDEERFFYYVSIVASTVALVWAFLDGNLLTFITFTMLLMVVVFELKTQPRDIGYEINIDGISIDGKLYRFEQFRSFGIEKKGEHDILKLQLKDSFFPIKEVYLDKNQDLEYIEALMEYFLPKEKQEDMLFNFRGDKKPIEDEFVREKVNEYLNLKSKF